MTEAEIADQIYERLVALNQRHHGWVDHERRRANSKNAAAFVVAVVRAVVPPSQRKAMLPKAVAAGLRAVDRLKWSSNGRAVPSGKPSVKEPNA